MVNLAPPTLPRLALKTTPSGAGTTDITATIDITDMDITTGILDTTASVMSDTSEEAVTTGDLLNRSFEISN